MILNRLELDFFRNYPHLEADFDPRVNLIYGDNAQGKTNLLEAVAYLSSARSHRARYDREMILLGVDAAFLKGELSSRGRDFTLEAKLFRGKGRQLWSNGVRLKTAGELAGIFTTVLFCPEDLSLVRAGGAERRKFLDLAICQLRPRYAQALGEYNRLYDHKTRILRDWPENPSLLQTLDDFNLRMAQTGAILIHYRAHFIRRLQDSAPPSTGTSPAGGRSSPSPMRRYPRSPTPWPRPGPCCPSCWTTSSGTGRRSWTAGSACPAPTRTTCWWTSTGYPPGPMAPRGRPAPPPSLSSWPSGRSFRRTPGSGPSFCWTTCCLSWTESGNPLC